MAICLGDDLVTEILLRLPIKSITRFKLVCKNWKTLIESYSHDDQLKSSSNSYSSLLPSLIIFLPNDTIFRLDLNLDKANNANYIENEVTRLRNSEFTTTCVERKSSCYLPLGSSNGLVCVYARHARCTYVWNPTTNVARSVGYPRVKFDKYHIFRSGFGFVSSINDYKFVMVVGNSTWEAHNQIRRYDVEIHVCSLKRNKWRSLDTSKSNLKNLSLHDIAYKNYWCEIINNNNDSDPVGTNDALHWIVGPRYRYNHVEKKERYDYFIIRFDLVGEFFEKTSNLSEKWSERNKMFSMKASIGVTNSNKICICHFYPKRTGDPYCMEIWVLQEYGVWDSWKKVVYFPGNWRNPGTHHKLLKISGGGKVVIMQKDDRKMNYLLALDGRRKPPSFVQLNNEFPAPYNGEDSVANYLTTYLPTWVSPYSI